MKARQPTPVDREALPLTPSRTPVRGLLVVAAALATGLLVTLPGGSAVGREPDSDAPKPSISKPQVFQPDAFAVSPPVSQIAAASSDAPIPGATVREETGPVVANRGHTRDGALPAAPPDADIPAPPPVSFEGINNLDGVSPPDPVGDVGPAHYVQMVNLRFAVYTKAGAVVTAPTPIGNLFLALPGVHNCEGNFGDPIVLHDQLANRWILTQFTAVAPFFNCVAISQTANPAGAYFLYAFPTGGLFGDYPKYGVWPNGYYISTREFNGAVFAGVGAYAANRAKMLVGDPTAELVKFLLAPGATPFRPGDGLLPSDLDGTTFPSLGVNSPNPFLGSMDNGGPYGAPADALNLFHLRVTSWAPPTATFTFIKQINVAAFDSIFPCAPGPRDCITQPGTAQKIDILSYRQRPLHRLAYRNMGSYETMVTNQSVEALANLAGIRWWEVRSPLNAAAFVFQQGTHVINDTNHRWMGSIAMDKNGNAALGYSISGPNVFPGIRYVGRLAGDALGVMPWTERVLINGAGSQTGSPRWGDYTSMNIDPADNCTLWYTNEYYQVSSAVGWRTRIGRFRFPTC